MSVRDTITLLQDLDPVRTHPRPQRSRLPRRSATRIAGVVAATAAVAAALAGTSDDGGAPGLAEAAYAALTAPDRVVHLHLHSLFHDPEDEPATAELWTRAGGRQLRVVYDGGTHEFVRNSDERYAASYVRHRNRLTVYDDPEMWQVRPAERLSFAGPEGAVRVADALPGLLARARDGDASVRRLPDAELDGRTAVRLETITSIRVAREAPADGRAPELEPLAVRTVIWLDRDTRLPCRIERFLGTRREATVDVVLAERLAVDDTTEALLEMPRHPGAERVVGGRG